jgi:hypothetical protein
MATSEGELWPPGHTGRKTRTLPVHRRWRRRRWVGRAAGAEIGRGRHADTTNPANGAEFTVRSGCSSLRHCRWRVEPTRVADKHSVQLRAQERVHHLRCSPVGDGGGGHKDLGACVMARRVSGPLPEILRYMQGQARNGRCRSSSLARGSATLPLAWWLETVMRSPGATAGGVGARPPICQEARVAGGGAHRTCIESAVEEAVERAAGGGPGPAKQEREEAEGRRRRKG